MQCPHVSVRCNYILLKKKKKEKKPMLILRLRAGTEPHLTKSFILMTHKVKPGEKKAGWIFTNLSTASTSKQNRFSIESVFLLVHDLRIKLSSSPWHSKSKNQCSTLITHEEHLRHHNATILFEWNLIARTVIFSSLRLALQDSLIKIFCTFPIWSLGAGRQYILSETSTFSSLPPLFKPTFV